MYCKNCGVELVSGTSICVDCGTDVGLGNSYCANCGVEVDPMATTCIGCGANLKKAAKGGKGGIPLDPSKRTVIAVIALLLGAFGVHNFILGETKRGIRKIVLTCFCGIGGILALVEFVQILLGTYTIKR